MSDAHAEPAVEDPDKGHDPALRRVATDAVPAEEKAGAERRAGDEGCEEEEDERGGVIEGLEGGDLGRDFERWELREGPCPRRSAAAWHDVI